MASRLLRNEIFFSPVFEATSSWVGATFKDKANKKFIDCGIFYINVQSIRNKIDHLDNKQLTVVI